MRSGRRVLIIGVLAATVAFIGCQNDPRPVPSRPGNDAPTTLAHDHIPPPRAPEN